MGIPLVSMFNTCMNLSPQANLADHTDNAWVTFFQETAEAVLGQKGDDIGRLKEEVMTGE